MQGTFESSQQRGQFADLPNTERYLHPYKEYCRAADPAVKLTDRQHKCARMLGFDDWQSLTYWMKQQREALDKVDLTDDEWGVIYDICNGWAVRKSDLGFALVQNVVDADLYDSIGSKWFGVTSKGSDEDYEPSAPMRAFIDKLQGYSPEQLSAITMKGLAFWGAMLV